MQEIQLPFSQIQRNSQGGNLFKWRIGNRFIKSQTFTEINFRQQFLYESYGEYIAYQVAREIGYDSDEVVPYRPIKISLPDGRQTVACESTSFVKSTDPEVRFYGIGSLQKRHRLAETCDLRGYQLYQYLTDKSCLKGYKTYIDKCLILDYIILNTDRHLNNIGYIGNIKKDKWKIPPIFDNGSCLGCDKALTSDIKYQSDMLSLFRSKPFYYDFDTQIQLVKSNIKINHDISRVYKTIDRLEGIPEYRKEFMIEILKSQIQNIKNHGI